MNCGFDRGFPLSLISASPCSSCFLLVSFGIMVNMALKSAVCSASRGPSVVSGHKPWFISSHSVWGFPFSVLLGTVRYYTLFVFHYLFRRITFPPNESWTRWCVVSITHLGEVRSSFQIVHAYVGILSRLLWHLDLNTRQPQSSWLMQLLSWMVRDFP